MNDDDDDDDDNDILITREDDLILFCSLSYQGTCIERTSFKQHDPCTVKP